MFIKSILARGAIVSAPLLGCALISVASSAVAAPVVHGPARPVQHPASAGTHKHAGVGVTLFGGGATLPALAYEGAQALTTNPGVPPFDAGTVFGQFLSGVGSGDSIQYCQTGSGYGKGVLNGTNPATGPCAPIGAAPTGFGVTGQTYADFAGSDSPVSQSEYNGPATGNLFPARGEFVQVPYIAGSVAILYNNSDITTQLSITPATLCRIADGEITNWNQVPKNPANPHLTFKAKPLQFIYRYDGSGTTFSFSNYLSSTKSGVRNVCKGNGETYGLSQIYDENNNSKGAGQVGVLPTTLPGSSALFGAGSGNAGVVACILGSAGASCYRNGAIVPGIGGDGSIGYVEAANAKSVVNGTSVNFSKIHLGAGLDRDPIADLPAAAKQITKLATDEVFGGATGSVPNGRPVPDISPLQNPPLTKGCLGIVDPASYESIRSGYPIVGVTNLEFTSVGNGTKATDLQHLATFTDTSNFPRSGITSVDPLSATTGTTGYSEIKLVPTSIQKLANCIGA